MTTIEGGEYSVDVASGHATLRGVLRLESVDAYAPVLDPIRARLDASGPAYTLDLTGVSLMNSSGIRALANLVLAAKRASAPLVIVASKTVLWQKKSIPSLAALFDRLEIRLE